MHDACTCIYIFNFTDVIGSLAMIVLPSLFPSANVKVGRKSATSQKDSRNRKNWKASVAETLRSFIDLQPVSTSVCFINHICRSLIFIYKQTKFVGITFDFLS